MAIFLQTTPTRVPVPARFSANAICSSVQQVFFMVMCHLCKMEERPETIV